MKITAIVTAGGMQGRWTAPSCKHLAVVEGQSLLLRLVQQLETFCDRISILAWRPEIRALCPEAWMPEISYREDLLPVLQATEKLWDERTLIVHGDVAFGTETMDWLKNWRGSLGFLGTESDIFAMMFARINKAKIRRAMDEAIAYGFSSNPLQHGRLKLWSLYRHLVGADPGQHEFGQDRTFHHSRDWTMDVDTLGQYVLLQEVMRRARAAGKL